VVFTPVDHPNVEGATVAKLIESGALIAIPQYLGRHGHPVLFSRSLIPEFWRCRLIPRREPSHSGTRTRFGTLMSRTANSGRYRRSRSISPAAASTMKHRIQLGLKWLGAVCALVVAAGIAAPFLGADRYAEQIRTSLETALGRRVEFGDVRFNLFTGPGFSISKVVIQEDPAFGREPFAYVESLDARPALWALIMGRRSLPLCASRTPD